MKIFLILFIILTSISLYANDVCKLDLKVISEHSEHDKLFTAIIKKSFKRKVTASREDCYKYAITEAKLLNTHSKEYSRKHLIRNEEGFVEKRELTFESGSHFIVWKFKTGIFQNHEGMVTKFSNIDLPIEGDARAIKGGEMLLDQ